MLIKLLFFIIFLLLSIIIFFLYLLYLYARRTPRRRDTKKEEVVEKGDEEDLKTKFSEADFDKLLEERERERQEERERQMLSDEEKRISKAERDALEIERKINEEYSRYREEYNAHMRDYEKSKSKAEQDLANGISGKGNDILTHSIHATVSVALMGKEVLRHFKDEIQKLHEISKIEKSRIESLEHATKSAEQALKNNVELHKDCERFQRLANENREHLKRAGLFSFEEKRMYRDRIKDNEKFLKITQRELDKRGIRTPSELDREQTRLTAKIEKAKELLKAERESINRMENMEKKMISNYAETLIMCNHTLQRMGNSLEITEARRNIVNQLAERTKELDAQIEIMERASNDKNVTMGERLEARRVLNELELERDKIADKIRTISAIDRMENEPSSDYSERANKALSVDSDINIHHYKESLERLNKEISEYTKEYQRGLFGDRAKEFNTKVKELTFDERTYLETQMKMLSGVYKNYKSDMEMRVEMLDQKYEKMQKEKEQIIERCNGNPSPEQSDRLNKLDEMMQRNCVERTKIDGQYRDGCDYKGVDFNNFKTEKAILDNIEKELNNLEERIKNDEFLKNNKAHERSQQREQEEERER